MATAKKSVKGNTESLLRQAAAKLDAMDMGSALALYQQVLAREPKHSGALMGVAIALNHTGKPAEALRLLEPLREASEKAKRPGIQTTRAAILAQIGLAQQQLGQMAAALQAFEQANKLLPSAALKARIDRIRLVAQPSDPLQHLLLAAQQAVAGGRLEEAHKAYAAALQLNADSPDALHGLAMLHRRQGASHLALPLMQKAVILAPDRADFFNELGLLFHDRGDLAKAVSFHRRALKVDPGLVSAQVNLGVALKRLGRTDEAIEAYRAALQIAPNLAPAHNNLGNLLRLTGDLTGAQKHLKEALRLMPDYADAKTNLAALQEAVASAKKAAAPARTTKAVKSPAVPKASQAKAAKPVKTAKTAKTAKVAKAVKSRTAKRG